MDGSFTRSWVILQQLYLVFVQNVLNIQTLFAYEKFSSRMVLTTTGPVHALMLM